MDHNNLRPHDVLFGRGSGAFEYVGNRRFRWLVGQKKEEYRRATRRQKQTIARCILEAVHDKGGRFLQMLPVKARDEKAREEVPVFEEVAEPKALLKCLHTLREKERAVSPVEENDQQQLQDAAAFVLSSINNNNEKEDIISDCTTEEESASVRSHSQHTCGRPTISASEEQVEKKLLSQQEQDQILAEMLGKYCTIGMNPEKKRKKSHNLNNRYIQCAVDMMRQEIELLPLHKRRALQEAQDKCSAVLQDQEFGDARLEQFLRCVDWYPKRAAERFAMYWSSRKQLFGAERYYLPMTLAGALRDDWTALQSGFCFLLPLPDVSGRQLQFFVFRNLSPGGVDETYPKESLIRACWYVTEVAIRQDSDHNGLVRFACGKDILQPNYFDLDMICTLQEYKRDCWPVKVMADHTICCSRQILEFWIPASRASKGKDGRLRSVIHDVPDSEVVDALAGYGILKEMLPTEVGGTIVFNMDEWVQNRRIVESEQPNDNAGLLISDEGEIDKASREEVKPTENKSKSLWEVDGELDDLLNNETDKYIDELGDWLSSDVESFVGHMADITEDGEFAENDGFRD